MHFSKSLALVALIFLAACAQEKPPSPLMKIGKPYEVEGTTYYPKYEPSYDQTGMGSWYGPGFHGKKTASGERFNEKDLTAASPTLPMPSLVRVTNLSNGESVIARVNDRGPFKSRRIIDLSRGSAERIGLYSTMKVRVQYLPKETEEYVKNWEANGKPESMTAYNDRKDSAPLEPIEVAEAAPKPEPSGAQLSFISEAHADESTATSSITATDLPSPEGIKQAQPQPLLQQASPSYPAQQAKPVYMEEHNQPVQQTAPSDAPFMRGPSVAAPAAPVVAAPAPQTVAAGEGYYVQAGTFSHKENADHLTQKLTGLAGTSVDKIARANGDMWRVRVGPFASKEAAAEALETVRAYVPDAHISH